MGRYLVTGVMIRRSIKQLGVVTEGKDRKRGKHVLFQASAI